MILKFTHPDFELDFTGKALNIVEENHWFSDEFFTKYSFPFEFDVDDEMDAALQLITHNNAVRSPKIFEGYFQKFGQETQALLIIERIQGRKAQGKLRYGFEEFPNYDKKLAELDLERFTLEDPIGVFALPFLGKTYPEVNYNFPQVIVDKFDTSSEQWQYFEGMLNNFRGGAFLVNEYNSGTGEQVNRNIMQPFPYLLYVIARGFAEKGLELRGEILTDPEFKDALISVISDYYSTSSAGNLEMHLQANEYSSTEIIRAGYPFRYDKEVGNYNKTILLQSPGVYKIAGNIILRTEGFVSSGQINLNGQNIWEAYNSYGQYKEEFFTIDRNVEIGLSEGGAALNFISQQLPYAIIDQNQDPEASILDLTITKIAGYDVDGNLVPTLVSPADINLQKCVPDITFGELLKVIKNWKNYDIFIGDGFVEMNKIENKMSASAVVDLSEYEIKDPLRNFYQDTTFLLQFQDISSEEYKFVKLFIDANGSRTSSFVKRDDTNEISINGIPLPMKQSGDVNTAHLFTDGQGTVALTIYPGLLNGLNWARNTEALLIPAIYNSSWKKWLDFRVNSEGFEWNFIVDLFLAGRLSQESKIYAYGRNFIVRRLSKKNISRNYWEITMECDGAD